MAEIAARGQAELDDYHGLLVYEDSIQPVWFIHIGDATGIRSDNGPTVVRAIQEAAARGLTSTRQEQLAQSILGTAFRIREPDARLVTLMTAVEALLPRIPRSPVAMEVFEQLVEHVERSDLAYDDKTSLLNSLRPLRHESINRSGQLFAAGRLGDRTYMDNPPESPAQFFKKSYGVRSNLVHGNEPQPDRRVVIERGLYLEGFVSHVLASALDDFDPRAAPPDAAPETTGEVAPDAGDPA